MDAKIIKHYLEELCRDLDLGRPLRKFDAKRAIASIAVPAAMGFAALGFGGCGSPQDQGSTIAPDAPPATAREDCVDGADNDGDGAADCTDSDCAQTQVCAPVVSPGDGPVPEPDPRPIALYAAPMRPDLPAPVPPYAAPMPFTPEDCRDGVDNDRDGAVDLDDPDCEHLIPRNITLYGVESD